MTISCKQYLASKFYTDSDDSVFTNLSVDSNKLNQNINSLQTENEPSIYQGNIILHFDKFENILQGQLQVNDNNISIANVNVVVNYTDNNNKTISHNLITNETGQFFDTLQLEESYIVVAIAQLETPEGNVLHLVSPPLFIELATYVALISENELSFIMDEDSQHVIEIDHFHSSGNGNKPGNYHGNITLHFDKLKTILQGQLQVNDNSISIANINVVINYTDKNNNTISHNLITNENGQFFDPLQLEGSYIVVAIAQLETPEGNVLHLVSPPLLIELATYVALISEDELSFIITEDSQYVIEIENNHSSGNENKPGNYHGNITLHFDKFENILQGQLQVNDNNISIANVNVVVNYTDKNNNTISHNLITNENGQFFDPLQLEGSYIVVAKAQVKTPAGNMLDLVSPPLFIELATYVALISEDELSFIITEDSQYVIEIENNHSSGNENKPGNYQGNITLHFDKLKNILQGQLQVNNNSILIANVNVVVNYTDKNNNTISHNLITNENGQFFDPLQLEGSYIVVAKAQVKTPAGNMLELVSPPLHIELATYVALISEDELSFIITEDSQYVIEIENNYSSGNENKPGNYQGNITLHFDKFENILQGQLQVNDNSISIANVNVVVNYTDNNNNTISHNLITNENGQFFDTLQLEGSYIVVAKAQVKTPEGNMFHLVSPPLLIELATYIILSNEDELSFIITENGQHYIGIEKEIVANQ